MTPDLENRLIGIRTFATGYEALIRTQDVPEELRADALQATIDDIVVFVSRQAEKEAQK